MPEPTLTSINTHEAAACRFRFSSPYGEIAYVWDGQCCHRLDLNAGVAHLAVHDDPVSRWLAAYFAHDVLPSLPPLQETASIFQHRLRQALLAMPQGATCTYGELAAQLHSGAQAVGQALGANPLPVLVPCHRVLSANGLGGFSCGLPWKRALLAHEGIALPV